MRQGITTRYLGPTNTKGSRYKAIARKGTASYWRYPDEPSLREYVHGDKEMSLTDSGDYALNPADNHTRVAKLLATKLGWSGLWVGGGTPEDTGYQYVCVGRQAYLEKGLRPANLDLGKEDLDWFYIPPQTPACEHEFKADDEMIAVCSKCGVEGPQS